MWIPAAAAAAPTAHHDAIVSLEPSVHVVRVRDELTLPGPPAPAGHVVRLHAGATPTTTSRRWRVEPADAPPAGDVPLTAFRLVPRRGAAWPVTLAYEVAIDHAPEQVGTEVQRSFETSPGLVGPDGAVLSGASAWLPDAGALVTFDLLVTGLPDGWSAVSTGERTLGADGIRWRTTEPTEEVHLVAGPFVERAVRYDRADGSHVDVRALLRGADDALADRYLGATVEDLALYESILPRFPWPGFSVVENAWDTGWGMPGFTLLGPQVLRFPFVLGSSYPHELVHNWWGNGVYVDPASGNWCEGLTAYLADHLFAERRGEGVDHRRATLQRYAAFAGGREDLALAAFHGRVSPETEAVGYGKAAMVLHMVRRALGDEAFRSALRRFWDDHAYARASWDDLAAAVSEESGADWRPWFAVWVERPGAPALAFGDFTLSRGPEGWTLAFTVRQTQPGPVFPLDVPVWVTVDGVAAAQPTVAQFAVGGPAEVTVRRTFDHAPLRLDLDPAFDAMRLLDPAEAPAALTDLFGDGAETYVIPASAPPEEQAAWRALAAAWAKPAEPTVVTDEGPLPEGGVWVLGWSNRHAAAVATAGGAALAPAGATVDGAAVDRAGHSVVVVAPRGPDRLGWVGAPTAAIPGLARKLPHYGRWSWLVFDGDEPAIARKGTTPPTDAPTTRQLGPGPVAAGRAPDRPALAP